MNISWKTIQKFGGVLSTIQAEYIILVKGVKEVIRLKGMIRKIKITQKCNSQNVLYLKNPQLTKREQSTSTCGYIFI